jgi:hypothetical protein
LSPGFEIQELLVNAIHSERLPVQYLDGLDDSDKTTASRACLLVYAVTSGTQVPRELQLRACLATYHGHDSLIDAGTGSGKTMPIALNLLLDDPRDEKLSLTISPLKRLQVTQVRLGSLFLMHLQFEDRRTTFNLRYGIAIQRIVEETSEKFERCQFGLTKGVEHVLGHFSHRLWLPTRTRNFVPVVLFIVKAGATKGCRVNTECYRRKQWVEYNPRSRACSFSSGFLDSMGPWSIKKLLT